MAGWGGNFRTEYLNSGYEIGSDGKRNIVTVIFPYDTTRPKAQMARLNANGYSGASIAQGNVVDVALESSREQIQTIGNVQFRANLLWCRKSGDKITAFFAQGARHFDSGADSRISF